MSDLLHLYVGRRISTKRRVVGITQEVLAKEVGRTRASITNIEAGRQELSLSLLYLIARALTCEAAELLPPMSEKLFEDGEELISVIINDALDIALRKVLDDHQPTQP